MDLHYQVFHLTKIIDEAIETDEQPDKRNTRKIIS